MAALANERATTWSHPAPRVPNVIALPVLAAKKIFNGAFVCISAGFATPGAVSTTLIAVGRAEETVDNSTGANGDKTVNVKQGAFWWNNSSAGDLIAQADVGTVCFVVDDQTVAKTNGGATRSQAGKVLAVDAVKGVLVLTVL